MTRGALRAWFASRLAVFVLTVAAASQLTGRLGLLAGWDSWDATLLREVAQYGYAGGAPDRNLEAFFPGFPLVLRGMHLLVPDWTAAGLMVSLLAGAVAAVALARLAALDGVDGGTAVLCLVLSPYAVFLTAGYSEALFLACALPGWLLARQGRWAGASLLVAGACLIRVNGAFLAVGLVVLFLTSTAPRRQAAWLTVPFLTLLGYAGYLHHLTGDWLRWQHAQAAGWGRHLTDPLSALRATYDASRNPLLGREYVWSFRAEILAVAVGLAVTAVLLRRRAWGEATYVGLSVAALACSTYYLSVGRATLLWFPLWLLLAGAGQRRPWLRVSYLVVSAPLMAVAVLTFTAGRWVG